MGTVTAFLQVYDDAKDWDELNTVICEWRKAEEKTRKECGLPSIDIKYDGCNLKKNIFTSDSQGQRRKMSISDTDLYQPKPKSKFSTSTSHTSTYDIIFENQKQIHHNSTYKPITIQRSKEDFDPVSNDDFDQLIEAQYENDRNLNRNLQKINKTKAWFNYFPMLAVRTEYYFRYSGTQTIPPCYGKFVPRDNKKQTNHWRVYKDPIRVTQRQIDEMHRLLRERIAPKNDPIRSCKADTAAKQDPIDPNKVWLARPLQETHRAHFKVFCECKNWKSKFIEDQEWCKMKDDAERLYQHPYNFKTQGF